VANVSLGLLGPEVDALTLLSALRSRKFDAHNAHRLNLVEPRHDQGKWH
jgi:hypothetical protein